VSYILDALKNSDKERKKGSVPDLQSQPDRLLPPAPVVARTVRRHPLLWISVLLVAALLAWLLSRIDITDSDDPATHPVVAEPVISPPAETVPRVEAEKPPPLPVDDDYLDALKDVQLDVAPVIEEEALESPVPAPLAADPPAAMSAELPVETVPVPEPEPIASAADPPAEEAAPVAPPDPYAGIPHQHQLPSDVQRTLPELEVTVHIYSATPSARLVRINRRNYQEGDLVDDQVRLEEITQDGLILSFGDIRYWRYVN
jgi:general secretion pathway protein B